MTAPFYRTLKQAKEKGFAKTFYEMSVITFELFLDRLKGVPEESVIEVNHSKMLVLPKKGGIHKELYLFGKREPLCTDYMMRSVLLKEGDVVLDIGANIGYYALVESQRVGNKGQVYAVEPVQSNYALLNKNINLNNSANVSTFKFALGDKNEKAVIYLSNWANLCAMNKKAVGKKMIGSEEVYMETVDTFLEDKTLPTLIRMDVEGYEYEILKGMAQTLKENVRILIELHPLILSTEKTDEIFKILDQNKFKVQFAVFENKVKENNVIRALSWKAGNKLPIVASNISLLELKELMHQNYGLAPNVVFEKQLSSDETVPTESNFQIIPHNLPVSLISC